MSRAKHYNKKKSNIPSIILMCFFTALLIYSGTKIVIWYMNNQNNKKISDEIAEFVTVDETKEDIKADIILLVGYLQTIKIKLMEQIKI